MERPLRSRIAKLIKGLRDYRGLRVSKLAERAGLNPGRVSVLEADGRPAHSEDLAKLAKALGVRPGFFFGDDDADCDLAEGVRRQTLRLFLARHPKASTEHKLFLWEMTRQDSGADTVKQLEKVYAYLIAYNEWINQRKPAREGGAPVMSLAESAKMKRRRRLTP